MAVYRDKVSDETDLEDNEAMRQGRDLEEYVAQRFMEETGLKVRRSNKMYRSVEYPWMIADVDRMVAGGEAGLSVRRSAPTIKTDGQVGGIPVHYLLQCYHYMIVTGCPDLVSGRRDPGTGFPVQKDRIRGGDRAEPDRPGIGFLE